MSLYQDWLDAKQAEKDAQDLRRAIEDALFGVLGLAETEGTDTIRRDGYKIKVNQRFNRTINADLLQEIAAEEGLTDHLGNLFRWKPEINARAWTAASANITRPLLGAITTKPGRPSFSIEKEESNDE